MEDKMHHHAPVLVLLMRHIRCILQGELCQANSGIVKPLLSEATGLFTYRKSISLLGSRIKGIKQLSLREER